jgi:hypothetical protein
MPKVTVDEEIHETAPGERLIDYGLMLTAWGSASAVGPLLIAYMRQTSGSYGEALHVIAGVMAISALVPILLSRPRGEIVDSRGRTQRLGPDSASPILQHHVANDDAQKTGDACK